jgi:hypothetical protein
MGAGTERVDNVWYRSSQFLHIIKRIKFLQTSTQKDKPETGTHGATTALMRVRRDVLITLNTLVKAG